MLLLSIRSRLTHGVAAGCLALFAASTAGATTFSVVSTSTSSGAALDQLRIGDTVTVGIRIIDAIGVYAIGASVWGYDEGVADFQSGAAVPSINHDVCFVSLGCFLGLLNTIQNGVLVESAIGTHGNRVRIFNGAGLYASYPNALDPGLDGVQGGNDAQIRVTFVATGIGSTVLDFGVGYEGDAVILAGGAYEQATPALVALTVIPEPGTALLLGLGMAGLAVTRSSARADHR